MKTSEFKTQVPTPPGAGFSELVALHIAASDLAQIVEGFMGERWTANGKRLVDTGQWCCFYLALKRLNECRANEES